VARAGQSEPCKLLVNSLCSTEHSGSRFVSTSTSVPFEIVLAVRILYQDVGYSMIRVTFGREP